MGQVLHGCATTTEAVRRAIQNSQESLRGLAKRYGINQKTVAKWKQRETVADRSTGPKEAKSTVLSIEEEAIIVAFRRHTLLPLDDCLYALQPTIPHLTRSSLHRCLQRHGISRLPEVEGGKPSKKKFKAYPIGYFHIDIAELQTAEGKLYLYVAIWLQRLSLPAPSISEGCFSFANVYCRRMEQDENEGLERLAAAALARAAETIADIFETTEEDGPAKLLLSALTLVVKFSLREHDRVVTIGRDHRPPDNISDSTSLYVTKPTTTDGLPKLAVWAYDHTGRLLGHAGWRRAVVEIYPGPPEVVTGIFWRTRAQHEESSRDSLYASRTAERSLGHSKQDPGLGFLELRLVGCGSTI